MAGSLSLSLSQQFDSLGRPLAGGLLYTYAASTTTPQSAYQDTGLTLAYPNPLVLDAAGRIPAFYLADGNIKIRLTDKNGVTQITADNLLVIGPSSGGGGGGPGVDATTIFKTGDCLWLDVSGTRSGWVRDNGRTIGSAVSGASERANADTAALYDFLWQTYDNTICPVSTGRGASSTADFAANKTITLPDKRGYVPGGLDDMGNSAAGRYASVPVVSGTVTTAGSVIGEATHALVVAEHASHDHDVYLNDPGHTHTVGLHEQSTAGGSGSGFAMFTSPTTTTSSATTGLQVRSATAGGGTQNKTNTQGSGTAHNTVQKTVLGTFFRKL